VSTQSGRLLYLAMADARGHLMRAHLLSGALGEVQRESTKQLAARAARRPV
jgi:hypothetical protein